MESDQIKYRLNLDYKEINTYTIWYPTIINDELLSI